MSFLALEVWLLPAIAAGSSSFLVSTSWARFRRDSAPGYLMTRFLMGLSFLMGALSAWYRAIQFARSLENNTLVMFIAGGCATFLWLKLRKHLPGLGDSSDSEY